MAHEQLSVPRSGIDQDLADLEAFPDKERFLFLREALFHPMFTGDIDRAEGIKRIEPRKYLGNRAQDTYDPADLPVAPTLPAEFVLPKTAQALDNDPRSIDTLRDLPKLIDTYYQTREHMIMNVPQCFMVRVPKDMDPILYMTMSECTAIIAHTDTDVIVAHVSFGMKSQTDAVMEYLRAQGAQPENIRIIANTMGDEGDFDYESLPIYPNPADRMYTKDEFLTYGIPEENFIGYVDTLLEGPDEIRAEVSQKFLDKFDGKLRPIAEVAVTNDDVYYGKSVQKAPVDPLTDGLLEYKHLQVG